MQKRKRRRSSAKSAEIVEDSDPPSDGEGAPSTKRTRTSPSAGSQTLAGAPKSRAAVVLTETKENRARRIHRLRDKIDLAQSSVRAHVAQAELVLEESRAATASVKSLIRLLKEHELAFGQMMELAREMDVGEEWGPGKSKGIGKEANLHVVPDSDEDMEG